MWTQTFFGSVKKRNASSPPSRPTPLAFMPPNGTRRSRTIQQLTQIVPESTASAMRWARPRFSVQIVAARPYGVPLAASTTSYPACFLSRRTPSAPRGSSAGLTRIWCWPTGLVSVTMYAVVFYQAKLYADMGLQGVYLALSVYGWWAWL